MATELHRARARYAFLMVESWDPTSRVGKTTASWLPGLPVLIRTQGLLVAMCLLKKDGASTLERAFEDWVLGKAAAAKGLPKLFGASAKGGLVELCTTADRATYQAAQREALALAEMLKLMAAAHGLKGEP